MGTKLGAWVQQRRGLVLALVFIVALVRVLLAQAAYREVNLLPGTRVSQSVEQ